MLLKHHSIQYECKGMYRHVQFVVMHVIVCIRNTETQTQPRNIGLWRVGWVVMYAGSLCRSFGHSIWWMNDLSQVCWFKSSWRLYESLRVRLRGNINWKPPGLMNHVWKKVKKCRSCLNGFHGMVYVTQSSSIRYIETSCIRWRRQATVNIRGWWHVCMHVRVWIGMCVVL